jgi:AcrR family transcriptional regulator
MSPRPRKGERSINLQEAIKETAWQHIARYGAPALSLRSIARALGITAPAIYNYYPDRDALVTALIIDAFTSLGDAQIAARDAFPPHDLIGRLYTIGRAYRQWALAHPQRYQLIFGAPIPGYVAPMDQVFPASARAFGALVSVVEAARRAGTLQTDSFPPLIPGYEALLEEWKLFGGDADILSLSVAVLIWARVHGLVSLQITGNLPPFGADIEALYEYEIASVERQFFRRDDHSG